MSKKSYSDLLKDPRWQKKRLEILQRDWFICQMCGDKSSTLHVHHFKYSGPPWDADSKDLTTLCWVCHSEVENMIKFYKKEFPGLFLSLDSYKERYSHQKITGIEGTLLITTNRFTGKKKIGIYEDSEQKLFTEFYLGTILYTNLNG